ncbi:tetratricopeptide repeat protein, partial [Neobacillus citreus]
EDEEEREFYEVVHAIWFSLFEELDDGKKVIEKFIAAEAGKIKRPKLKQIFQTWTNGRTIAGKVLKVENNKLTVEDGFTGELLETIITGTPADFEEGTLFLGMLVPFGQNFAFFPAPFDLPDLKPEVAFSYIEDSSIAADYPSPQQYLDDFFIEVLSELPMVGGLIETDDIEWPAPVYKEVADLFKAQAEAFDTPAPVVDAGIVLWFSYCQKRKKRIQNPNLYAAGLHYLMQKMMPMLEKVFTQKELGQIYSVSARSISTISSDMENVLSQEISEMMNIVYGGDEEPKFEEAEVIEFPKGKDEKVRRGNPSKASTFTINIPDKLPKKVSRRNEDRAQELVFEALRADGVKVLHLIQEAININPYCVDAFVLLGDIAQKPEESAGLYWHGIQVGEKHLGKEFFKENEGYFWGLIETRPYMRAKFNYAETIFLLGKTDEAIEHYEELLKLNPMDNQGVRTSLFMAYMEKEEFEKAEELLGKFDEETTETIYNRLLLELLVNGYTVKAKTLVKQAKKSNRFVLYYLTGKKKLPNQTPEYYGFGDENEAIVYAAMHLHLWGKVDGLKEWLKGK